MCLSFCSSVRVRSNFVLCTLFISTQAHNTFVCLDKSLRGFDQTIRQTSFYFITAYIRARASGFVREQRKSVREQGDSRSRIILIYFRATKMRSGHLAVK